MRHAKDMITVEKQSLTQARALAVRQTAVPAVIAADHVSILLEPDEGEYQGVAAAAQPDRPSHGGRASSPRKARLAALLVMAETVLSKTDDEKGDWNWKGRSEVVEAIALLASVSFRARRADL